VTENIPRLLLALAVIFAIGTISLGIKDHFQEKNAQPPANTPSVQSNPNPISPQKKIFAKTGRAQAPKMMQTAADDVRKSLIAKESSNAGSKGIFVSAQKTVSTQATQGEKAAMDQNYELDRKIARPALSRANCLPLPNGTNLKDADAPYYKNWAREYSCYDTIQSTVAQPKLK